MFEIFICTDTANNLQCVRACEKRTHAHKALFAYPDKVGAVIKIRRLKPFKFFPQTPFSYPLLIREVGEKLLYHCYFQAIQILSKWDFDKICLLLKISAITRITHAKSYFFYGSCEPKGSPTALRGLSEGSSLPDGLD